MLTGRLPDELIAGPLVLRRRSPDELSQMMEAIEESYVELRPWMPWAQDMPTAEQQLQWLQGVETRYDACEEFRFGIYHRESGRYVGGCGAHRRVGPRAIELGYWIRTSEAGQGYATAAMAAVSDAVFEHICDVDHIEIHTDAANHRSAAVARKLGFRHDRTIDWPIEASGQTGRRMVWILRRPRPAAPQDSPF